MSTAMVFSWQDIIPNAPSIVLRILASLIIVIVGVIVGHVVGKLLHRILQELEVDRIIGEYFHVHVRAEQWVSILVRYGIYVIAIIWALKQLGITSFLVQLGIVLLIVALSILVLLRFKSFLPNLIAGIMIQRKRSIIIGEKISVGSIEGRVRNIGFTETKIETKDGDIVFVPNVLFMKEKVVQE